MWNNDLTFSEVFAANVESGTWIVYDSKLLNLENLEVENDTGNATQILRNLQSRQSVDPDSSMERTHVWTRTQQLGRSLSRQIDNDHVNSKNQDKEVILDHQKPPVLLSLNGVESSTNAQNAQVE